MVIFSGLVLPRTVSTECPDPRSESPPLHRILTLDDIRRLCKPIFSRQDCRQIQWAAVFGVYARKEQKKNSEIEFLVGFPANTPWSKVHRTLHIVERDLPVALGRPVDALDMRDGELREYIELDALESSKRVYGHPNWSAGCLHASAKLILDAHRKIIRVGDLMVEIGKLITSKGMGLWVIVSPEHFALRSSLVALVSALCQALTIEKTHPFHGYFPLMSDWILNERNLIKRLESSAHVSENIKDWILFWGLLQLGIIKSLDYLVDLYVPMVQRTGKHTREDYERYNLL